MEEPQGRSTSWSKRGDGTELDLQGRRTPFHSGSASEPLAAPHPAVQGLEADTSPTVTVPCTALQKETESELPPPDRGVLWRPKSPSH